MPKKPKPAPSPEHLVTRLRQHLANITYELNEIDHLVCSLALTAQPPQALSDDPNTP